MHFDIRRLRFKGKPIEDRKLSSVQPIRGDVCLQWEQESLMGRPSQVAVVLHVQPKTATPPLSTMRRYTPWPPSG